MSTTQVSEAGTLKQAAQDYWAKVKTGDIGPLAAILGLVVL